MEYRLNQELNLEREKGQALIHIKKMDVLRDQKKNHMEYFEDISNLWLCGYLSKISNEKIHYLCRKKKRSDHLHILSILAWNDINL
ncbi:unnamed protein product [Parnassius apollo]|uniref:(apollo) hypothetical protein n=1 Tax=Parnassius apollo TaxID=110799 RepID=A0A8S3WXM0_PARAO|nr:unnamed protein product [Parnassius apollo]